MKILISNSSDLPLYQQIKEQLKDAILQGDLKDGDSMPSIQRQMCIRDRSQRPHDPPRLR